MPVIVVAHPRHGDGRRTVATALAAVFSVPVPACGRLRHTPLDASIAVPGTRLRDLAPWQPLRAGVGGL